MKIHSLINTVIGKITWVSPPWFNSLKNKARQCSRKFWLTTFISLFFLVAAFAANHWYQTLPKPERVIAKITAPQLSTVDKELIPDKLTIDFGIPYQNELNVRSVAPLNLIGKEVTKGISMNPKMDGQWRWESDSHLVFTPNKDWPAGQDYTVQFEKDFFKPGIKMKDWHASFSTLPLTAQLSEFKFYHHPLNPKSHQVVATIYFSFPVDEVSLVKKISLKWQSLDRVHQPDFKFTLTFDKHKRTAYLLSEELPIQDHERFLQLTLAKGIKALTGPSTTTKDITQKVLIPDASSFFKIVNLSTSIVRDQNDRPEQVLTLETTLGVTERVLNKSLHAYSLPQDYPATRADEAILNYAWHDPGEVTPAILALAKPISLNAIPADRDYATLHHFKYTASTPSYIYVTLDKGISGEGDFKLATPYSAIFPVPFYPQEISFLHKGSLLALGSEEKLSVLVRGLSAVKFDIARVLPNEINHLITQTRGEFSNPYFTNLSFNQDNISELFSDIQQFDDSDKAKAQYTALDLGKYLASDHQREGPRGLFLLQAHGWDPVNKLELEVHAKRLVLVTDLGLIVKDNSDGTHDLFVQSITHGTPVNNVNVSLLGKNGVPILTVSTDAQGHAHFPFLQELINDREPTVYVVRQSDDVSFIPYQREDRQLNFSRYDVGGVTNEERALSAYLFTERGIYRPGDLIHVAMVVKQSYAQASSPGLPLEAMVIDPRGVTIKDQKITLNDSGYFTLDFQTLPTSATGRYEVNLHIVKDNHASNLIGSTTLHVDEFLPDRMRISTKLSQQAKGWISPDALTAKVTLQNLYGTPAPHHRINGKIILTPQAITFREFPDYIFVDPLLNPQVSPKVFTDTLTETRTDDQGQADFDLKLNRFDKATYELTFFAEGFEAEGGRSVTTQTTAIVSPLSVLVGYKADGDLNYIKKNAARKIHLIAINPQLKQQSLNNLRVELKKLQPVSTLVKKENGTYQYQSIIQTTSLSQTPLNVSDQGSDYILPTQQIGDFLVSISDQNGVELSKLKFSVVGSSQETLPKNAELKVKLKQSVFNAGDDIEMQIIAPYTGAGLITIERDKVYATQWFKADATSSLQKIKIPPDFQGDGYVNITFVRDLNSSDIFMSPLSYSVLPFSVSHRDHDIKIDLQAPKLAKPGTPLIINYKTDKPSKIIVFAVDEGILQVTKFQTPDPLKFFFQKHALEVQTQQIVDQILPKFLADREFSAVGGDGGEAYINKNLNPFKRKTDAPVVFWSGIIESDATPKQLTYSIPDYFNGSIRIMAVAVGSAAIGSAMQSTDVRGDFVINPNVPTFVAPGDEFDVHATVANNLQGSGPQASVIINLSITPSLQIVDAANKTLIIPEGQERSVEFKVKATSQLGEAKLFFTATHGNSSKLTTTLSVRPPVSYSVNVTSGYSTDKEKSLKIHTTFYPEYRKAEVAVSASPLILVAGLEHYLRIYPYGCVEQLVSKAFPWLSMAEQPWFVTDKVTLSEKIQKTIELLVQRQMTNGAFNYWPGSNAAQNNNFPSVYAMHFLTEAIEKGYAVPRDVFSAGINFLKEIATQEATTLEQARVHAYAIYLLTRNEIVTTNYLTNLQLSLDQNKNDDWHRDILSAYIAATFQLLKNTSEAERIIGQYQPNTQSPRDVSDFNNTIIDKAQYLYLLAKHFPEQLSNKNDLVISLTSALNDDTMSTVVAGFASLALSNYGQYHQSTHPAEITLSELLKTNKQNSLSANNATYQQAKLDVNAVSVKINNPSKQGYFYQVTQSGYDQDLPTQAIHQGIELYREYVSQNATKLSNVPLGDELEVHIRVRALDNLFHSNVAIIDLLPGGFEVVRDSIKASTMDYSDTREDRVIFFGSISPDSHEIVYRIKATSAGKFTIPPIFGMGMYNAQIKSLGVSGTVVVMKH